MYRIHSLHRLDVENTFSTSPRILYIASRLFDVEIVRCAECVLYLASNNLHIDLRILENGLALQWLALQRLALQWLHHTATHCNTLQHVAAHCSTLQRRDLLYSDFAHSLCIASNNLYKDLSILQNELALQWLALLWSEHSLCIFFAVCCSVLQCVAVCCSVLLAVLLALQWLALRW